MRIEALCTSIKASCTSIEASCTSTLCELCEHLEASHLNTLCAPQHSHLFAYGSICLHMGASVCKWEHPFANGTWRGIFSPGLKKKVPFTNGTGFHLQMGGSHLQMGAICKWEVTPKARAKPFSFLFAV